MLNDAFSRYTGSAAYKGGESALSSLAANPYTMGPDQVARIKADQLGSAQTAFDANLGRLHERQAAQGLYRSGSTRLGEDRLLGGFANDVGRINRDVDIQAEMQRPKDIANLLGTALPWLNATAQFGRDAANLRQGYALSPAAGSPTVDDRNNQFMRNPVSSVFGKQG